MIFLPNKFERYTSALRNTIQRLIIKNGIKLNYKKMLMKIHIAEALYSNEELPTDIFELSNEILKSVHIKKSQNSINFSYKISNIRNYIINRKLFISLILFLSNQSDFIEIKNQNEKIIIKAKNLKPTSLFQKYKKLVVNSFVERKSKTALIILSGEKTAKEAYSCKKADELLGNPLSEVNIYF